MEEEKTPKDVVEGISESELSSKQVKEIYRKDAEEEAKEKKKKLTKMYYSVVSSFFIKIIKLSSKIGSKKKNSRSFVNLLHPNFLYKFIGDYRITRNSPIDNVAYLHSFLCKASYESRENLKKVLGSIIVSKSGEGIEILQEIRSTHAEYPVSVFAMKMKNIKIVHLFFKGSPFFELQTWERGFDFQTISPWMEHEKVEVHKGFYMSLFVKGKDGLSLYTKILKYLRSIKKPNEHLELFCSGHSSCGAIASILTCMLELEKNNHVKVHKCLTFGSPKCGNREFCRLINAKCWRYVNDLDFIAAIPEWMEAPGKLRIVTALLSVKAQMKVRAAVPIFMYSFPDHSIGAYVTNLCRIYKFAHSKGQWKRYVVQEMKKIGKRNAGSTTPIVFEDDISFTTSESNVAIKGLLVQSRMEALEKEVVQVKMLLGKQIIKNSQLEAEVSEIKALVNKILLTDKTKKDPEEEKK